MNKNTIIGLVLIGLLVAGFTFFQSYFSNETQTEAQTQTQTQTETDSIDAEKVAKARVEDSTRLANQDTALVAAKQGKGEVKVLKNNLVSLEVNTKGGVISKATLSEYKNQEEKNVVMFDESTSELNFALPLKNETVNTTDLVFKVVEATDSTLTLTSDVMTGASLTFEYALRPNSYMVDMTITGQGLEQYYQQERKGKAGKYALQINWKDKIYQQERGYKFEQQRSSLTYKENGGGTDYMRAESESDDDIDESLDWIAFKNQFFSYVFINYSNFVETHLETVPEEKGSGFLTNYYADMKSKFDPTGKEPTKMQFYMGPNKYSLLKDMNKNTLDNRDLDLEDLVYMGWPVIREFNKYVTVYLFDWFTKIGIHVGLVLLIITIILKIAVYPFTRKSYISSAKMRVLRPKVEEINKKYPNQEDALKKQQETMALYSQYGANPMGGCLPMLIQMPIWVAMFNFVPNAIELRKVSFLWADDLSTYEKFLTWDTDLPLIGDHLSIFCILFCASNLLYSWLNMKMQKDTMAMQQGGQMKMMQWMMMLMPLMFFFMFNDYGAGLNYYYFISLIGSALTMWILRWRTDDAKLLAKLEENYRKNKDNPKKASNFMARMQALQEMQQQQQQNKK